MRFNQMTLGHGFQKYKGLEEYPKEEDFDGTWGIFDEPYLQYWIKELNNETKPFISTIFTLSSHNPYPIPEQYINKFKKGTLPIHESIGYSDYALQQFFKEAQKTDWFNNTLFVITADHTSYATNEDATSDFTRLQVPIVFYHPTNSKFQKTINDSTVISHIDIFPSIIDALDLDTSFYCFGTSIFDASVTNTYLLNEGHEEFTFITPDYAGKFANDSIQSIYKVPSDSLLLMNLKDSIILKEEYLPIKNIIKAKIQRFNHDVSQNKIF